MQCKHSNKTIGKKPGPCFPFFTNHHFPKIRCVAGVCKLQLVRWEIWNKSLETLMSCVTWVTKWNSAALTRVEWWPFWQISSANSKQFYFISLIFFYRKPQTLYSRAQGFWWSFSCDDLRAGNNIYVITMTCASSNTFILFFRLFVFCIVSVASFITISI